MSNEIEVKNVIILEGNGTLVNAADAVAAMNAIMNGAEVIEA